MNFPLQLRFKIFGIAPQIFVTDSTGAQILYVKQKLFKLREAINVFSNDQQTQQVASINANSMIDWSAGFKITGPAGESIGTIARKGWKSLWRAHYELFDAADQPAGNVREESPLARIVDSMIAEIPVVGALSIYVFQPKYLLTDAAGTPILRLKKKPSFVGRHFEIEKIGEATDADLHREVLSLLMMVMLERQRK